MATGRVPTTANSPLTAKGDLFGYSTTQARVAVGSDGDTLVADSAATTGLRWQGNFAAGKNKIINGDFEINQRAFSSSTGNGVYIFDRWQTAWSGGTSTYTAQTFTLGTAPVSGYESKNFVQIQSTGQSAAADFTRLDQKFESVRTFAGQTVTVSFWAKATSGTPSIAASFYQVFGTGGSPSTFVTINGSKSILSTSWQRVSFTIAIPSISGKTIGTNNNDYLQLSLWSSAGTDYNSITTSLGIQSTTIQIWGVQVEAGSVATAFQTATGTLQGELAACQRYYQRFTEDVAYTALLLGMANATTTSILGAPLQVAMRTSPTFAATNVYLYSQNNIKTVNSYTNRSSKTNVSVIANTSGLTAGEGNRLEGQGSSNGYLEMSAEL